MTQPPPAAAGRVERKKEETKQKIIAAALGLFQQQGFDATTMEQIAAQADIAKGTLYSSFPVKEAILSEFIKRRAQEKNPQRIQRLRALPNTRARLTYMLGELIEGVQAQPVLFERYFTYQLRVILSLEKTAKERSGIEQLETELILLGQAQGEIRRDLPLGLLVDQVDFIFIEVAKQYYLAPETFDAEEVIAMCVDLFLNGVKAADRPQVAGSEIS
jgi:AcrR family transcriptional regulator